LENLEGAESFKKPKCREHNNIEMDVDWIHLALEEVHWQALAW
jgi:hypothetical protein